MLIDPLLTLAHTMAFSPGTQAILLGSGVSRSARILTGWEITLDLVRRLAALEGRDDLSDPKAWYVKAYGKVPDYSELLQSLAKTAAERRLLLHGYFEPTVTERETGVKYPTAAHRSVARLAAQGFVRVVLTTNFDRLMETALREEGIEPTVVSTADGVEGATPVVHQHCLVVKLHGDYLDDRIKNTETELATYDLRMDQCLDRILEEFGLIVCGWSGEWDPALRSAMQRCKSRRYTTTWVSVGEPKPRAKELIILRGAQVIKTTGADSFFPDLAEKVISVAALKTPSPMSVSTAVSTLKRYLAEDRHRISLEDLILDETNQIERRLRELPFQGGPQPTVDLASNRVRQMDAACETLRALFFHGCRLSKDGQGECFLRALRLIIPPGGVNGLDVWTNAACYPMISILYSGALGALSAGNWSVLRKLLRLRHYVHGEEHIACDHFAAFRALPQFVSQALFHPDKRQTPVSDHFLNLLSPLVSGLHPDPERLFDELEIWVELAYLDWDAVYDDWDGVKIEKIRKGRFPAGRFCRHAPSQIRRLLGQFFAEVDSERQGWPPLAAGWFGGDINRWDTIERRCGLVWAQSAPAMT